MQSTARFLAVFLVLFLGGGFDRDAIAAEVYRLDAETYSTGIKQAAGHPNELSRWRGLWSYSNQRYAEARRHFERGAHYGDKPSQYLLSVMNLHGEGGAKNPVAAYIWADLAAERGSSREVLLVRERIWLSLSDAQKRDVEARGPGYYDRYGDAVAMKRTNTQLVRFSRHRTGSRTGSDPGKMTASLGGMSPSGACPTAGALPMVDAFIGDIYATGRTNLDEYWSGQEFVLRNIALGSVRVGGLKRVP